MILAASCAKDSPKDEATYIDDFRFYVKANVDGLPIEFYAGEKEYFLETQYWMEDSVPVLSGTLSSYNSMYNGSVVLRIRGAEALAGPAEFQVQNTLRPTAYPYRDQSNFKAEAGYYELQFYGDTLTSPSTYFWEFENGQTTTDQNPVVQVHATDYPTFRTKLTTTTSGSCQSAVTHYVNLAQDCDAGIEISGISAYSVKVKVNARVGTVNNVKWYLDGNEVAPDFLGVLNVGSLAGPHSLRAEIKFAGGCEKVIVREIRDLPDLYCISDFWYEKTEVKTFDPKQLGTVELEYYDKDGKKFTTYYNDVDGDFKIVSLSPYKENDQGQRTTRFFFEANAVLRNSDGSSVSLTECFGSFAVAHP